MKTAISWGVGMSRILKITDISDEPPASNFILSPTMKMEKADQSEMSVQDIQPYITREDKGTFIF
jgi:hypothetical protein